jgi:hypothetical protein
LKSKPNTQALQLEETRNTSVACLCKHFISWHSLRGEPVTEASYLGLSGLSSFWPPLSCALGLDPTLGDWCGSSLSSGMCGTYCLLKNKLNNSVISSLL